jgi:hypothetical protein
MLEIGLIVVCAHAAPAWRRKIDHRVRLITTLLHWARCRQDLLGLNPAEYSPIRTNCIWCFRSGGSDHIGR